MRRHVTVLASALAALAILTACASGGAMPDPTSPNPSPTDRFETTTPGPVSPAPTPSGSPTEVPEARWDAIVDDLAARGVTATPELVSAEAVTFTDGSLGCPRPTESYTQALIDGMRVIVVADGTHYDYRFGNGDSPRLCER